MQLTLLRVRLGHGLSVAALVVAGVLASAAIATGQGEPAPVRVGGTVKPPVRLKTAPPVYPPIARQARTQGVVIVETTIGVDGKVKSTKVVKSIPQLDNAAMESVKKWEFQPTVIDGKPTPVIMVIPVNFKLD